MTEQEGQWQDAASGPQVDAPLSVRRTNEARKKQRIQGKTVSLLRLKQAAREVCTAFPGVVGKGFGHDDFPTTA